MSFDPIYDPKTVKAIQLKLKRSPREFMLFNFMFHTGLKVTDIISLKIKDVCDQEGRIKEEFTIKTESGKKNIAINSCLKKYLRNYIKHHYIGNKGYLFPGNNPDTHVTAPQTLRALKLAAQSAGFMNFGINTLPKTWAYMLFRKDQSKLDYITEFFEFDDNQKTLKFLGTGK